MIFVYMSYAPDDACIKWMDKIVKAHSDRIAVLCLHDYFKTDMTLSDSGEQIFERVVKKNKNVYMVMCGHRYNIGCKAIDIDDDGDGEFDRRVYQLMSNYQAAGEEGGSGYMHFCGSTCVRGNTCHKLFPLYRRQEISRHPGSR